MSREKNRISNVNLGFPPERNPMIRFYKIVHTKTHAKLNVAIPHITHKKMQPLKNIVLWKMWISNEKGWLSFRFYKILYKNPHAKRSITSNYARKHAGDFNARIGARAYYIVCDSHVSFIDDDDYVPDTPIMRHLCNSHGVKLLDLCKSTSFRANGRLGNDKGGSFAYVCHNANSTILTVVGILLLKTLMNDHAPLSFSLVTLRPKHEVACTN